MQKVVVLLVDPLSETSRDLSEKETFYVYSNGNVRPAVSGRSIYH